MKYLIVIIISLLFMGCSQINPQNYKYKEYEKKIGNVSDRIAVKVNPNDYSLERVVAGENQETKKFVIDKIGKRQKFQKGDIIEIETNGFNFDRAMIGVISDNTGTYELYVADKYYNAIEFEKECQCFEYRNVTQIPPINVRNGLNPQQIIITPIFNNSNDCILVGYQVRYGDQQLAGCWNEAGDIYKTFKDCFDTPESPHNQYPCLEWILFGEECE